MGEKDVKKLGELHAPESITQRTDLLSNTRLSATSIVFLPDSVPDDVVQA